MMKAEHFERELSLIKSPVLRDQIREYLNEHTPNTSGRLGHPLPASITPSSPKATAVWFAIPKRL